MREMCQSCGMIMDVNDYGKNKDGSENKDYCHYCFTQGTFGKNETMVEMIESCIPFRISADCPNEEVARENMMQYFPELKRWKKDI